MWGPFQRGAWILLSKMFSISAFVRHFWLLWKERNQVFLAFLGVRLGIFLSIVVRFILRGCIFSWFRSLFSVSSSRSPPSTHPPPLTLSHTHLCVCVCRRAQGSMLFHAGTCVNVCAWGWGGDLTWHLLLGWIGSVAGPFSRQQLLVVTTNPTPWAHQSLQDYNWIPELSRQNT